MLPVNEPPNSLADLTVLCHAWFFVTAQERVHAFDVGATALAADSVGDLWNLTDLIEQIRDVWRDAVPGKNPRCVDTGSGIGVLSSC